MKIIGFVGMPGSGKSVASDVARCLGLEVVVMGDIIRKEAERLCLSPSDENLGRVGNLLRANEGPFAVAKRTLEQAKMSGKDCIVVDGIRSREEVEFFRSNSDHFRLVEVRASAEARLKRIACRGRSDDANCGGEDAHDLKGVKSCKDSIDNKAADALERRECRELGWGMCDAIKAANLVIDNNGCLDEFRSRVQDVLKDMKSC